MKLKKFLVIIMCLLTIFPFTGCGDNGLVEILVTDKKSSGYLFDITFEIDEQILAEKDVFEYKFLLNSAYEPQIALCHGVINKTDTYKNYPKRFKVSRTNSILGPIQTKFNFYQGEGPSQYSLSKTFNFSIGGSGKKVINNIKTFQDLESKNGIVAFYVITNGSKSSNDYNHYLTDPEVLILIALQINIS